jgi:hypothetical protein
VPFKLKPIGKTLSSNMSPIDSKHDCLAMTQKWALVRFPCWPVSSPTLAKLTKTKQRQWQEGLPGFQ